MAANAQVYQTTTIQGSPIVTTAETVVATIASVSIDQYGANIRFLVDVGLTPAADSTDVVLRIRRNNVTGTVVVGPTTIVTTPAAASQLPLIGAATEPVGQRSYVVTAVVTAASANTTVNNVTALAIVGN